MAMNMKANNRWIVGITGASGAVYGVTLCRFLLENDFYVHLLITDAGWRVLQDELEWMPSRRAEMLEAHFGPWLERLEYHPIGDIGANIASGSYLVEGMVIVPSSMGSMAAIAAGMSNNLLQRAADVMIKENRKLILVPRETPFSTIHIENMLKLSKLGVRIIPAMPAFYNRPKTIDDLVRFQVGKVLDSMQIDNQIYDRWGADNGGFQAKNTNM